MTSDQINKLRDALNLIAQIPVFRDYDKGEREEAHSLIKQVIDSAKNPFTEHWRSDES